jgi:hypothetical protein
VADNVVDLLKNTSSDGKDSLNVAFLQALFKQPANVDSLLCSSSLYERARRDFGNGLGTKKEHQLSAKLHCLYGLPILYPRRTDYKPAYPYAASKVYDLRQYTDKTLWGPFMDDGSQYVDWEKVEAIMVVLGHNIQVFSDKTNGAFDPIWIEAFSGATADSFSLPPFPVIERPLSSLDLKDPYNVTGTWMRVCSSYSNSCL